ncbi:MAG: HlyD family type I secretion periplasmic adaptor subunit [Desulfobulbaceae bacterium]|jgi:HlyD family type I secretion membrane fusion protein|nr:HlyD family type I secretion periplasmic adaptor subunit [Desulfobulbaceae bacterium]
MTDQNKTGKFTLWSNLFRAKVSDEEYEQLEDSSSPPPELGIGFSNSKWIIAAGLIVVGLFFVAGGLFVHYTEISGAVIAPGIVKAKAERQTVQHLEGGIVKEILVKEGDQVDKGQSLLILESSRILASVDQLRGQLYARQITAARLQAEKTAAAEINWPAELLAESGKPLTADLAFLMESENKIFTSKLQAMQGQIDLLNKQIEQVYKENNSLQEQGRSTEEIIQSLQEELQAKQALSDDRFLEKSVVLEMQRSLAGQQGQRAMLRGMIAENRGKIAELKIKINAMRNAYIEQATTELGPINSELLDLRDQLLPLDDAQTRLTVIAPIAGEIASLNIHSPGGVLPPGGEILDILPLNSEMVVECPIQVQDVVKINRDQRVEVRLSAFNAKTLSKVNGHVTYISADREERKSASGRMQPFYMVQISLDKDDLRNKKMYVSAGMPAMVFFITKPRTILDYITEPLTQNFVQAHAKQDKGN